MIKIFKRFLIIVFLVLLLSACATAPTATQTAEADYGSYPSNYKEIIIAYYSRFLIDPYSAHYRWISAPYKGYMRISFTDYEFGYIVKVGINAKNRLGGYVGERERFFLIKDGVVISDLPAFNK